MLVQLKEFEFELPYTCVVITFNLTSIQNEGRHRDTNKFLLEHALVIDYEVKTPSNNPDETYAIPNKFQFIEKSRISQFDCHLESKTIDYVEFEKGTVEINPYFTLRFDEFEKTKNLILETNPQKKSNKEYLLLSYKKFANVSELTIEKTILEEYEIEQKMLELTEADEVISLLESAYNSEPSLQTKDVETFIQLFKEEKEKIIQEFHILTGFSKK